MIKIKKVNFEIKDRKIEKKDFITMAGKQNVDVFHFEFDNEWENLDKTLVLIVDGKTYNIALLNNEVILPKEAYVKNGGYITVGIFGKNGNTILSSTLATVYITKGAYAEGEEPSNLPLQTQWDLYIAEINNLLVQAQIAEKNAKTSEANAKTYANNAEQTIETVNIVKTEVEETQDEVNKTVENFNKNVENHTTEFNQNATKKINNFDTNAEQKTTDFNENYTEKLEDFNNNAEQITTNIEELQNEVEELESIVPTANVSGEMIYIDNAKSYKMLGETIDGKYEQGENPSPDNPQEIKQITNVVLKSCGKNLLNVPSTYEVVRVSNVPIVLDAGEYILTYDSRETTGTNYSLFRLLYDDGTYVQLALNSTQTEYQIHLDKQAVSYLLYSQNSYNNSSGVTATFKNMMISKAGGEYEEYQEQIISIDLQENELCAISSTIKDKLIIDKKGNVALKKNVEKLTFSGDDGWIISTSYGCFAHSIGHVINKMSKNSLSNLFEETNIDDIKNNANRGMYTKYTGTMLVGYSDVTLEEFKAFLNTNNLIVYCYLDTPEIIELPKLTELPQTLEGINHICAETNLGTTNVEVEYVEDLQKEIEKIKTAIVALGGI